MGSSYLPFSTTGSDFPVLMCCRLCEKISLDWGVQLPKCLAYPPCLTFGSFLLYRIFTNSTGRCQNCAIPLPLNPWSSLCLWEDFYLATRGKHPDMPYPHPYAQTKRLICPDSPLPWCQSESIDCLPASLCLLKSWKVILGGCTFSRKPSLLTLIETVLPHLQLFIPQGLE